MDTSLRFGNQTTVKAMDKARNNFHKLLATWEENGGKTREL